MDNPRHFCFRVESHRIVTCLIASCVLVITARATEPFLVNSVLFEEQTDGATLYRSPGIMLTPKTHVLSNCEATTLSAADHGEIKNNLRPRTEGDKPVSPPVQVAHLGPRLPGNPVRSPGKKAEDLGGPNEKMANKPATVASRSGRVHLLSYVEYIQCFWMVGDDDGQTRLPPFEITRTKAWGNANPSMACFNSARVKGKP